MICRESVGIISLIFGDLERPDQGHLRKNRETAISSAFASKNIQILFLSSKTTFLSFMVLLRYPYDLGHERFFNMSKYKNSRPDSKNFKFFSPPVFQIIDSKHGSPEDYSDFFFFFFFSSSSRSRAMRSPRHNSSKILSN